MSCVSIARSHRRSAAVSMAPVRGEDVDDLAVDGGAEALLGFEAADFVAGRAELGELAGDGFGCAGALACVAEDVDVGRLIWPASMAKRATIRPPTRHQRTSWSSSAWAILATVRHKAIVSGSSASITIGVGDPAVLSGGMDTYAVWSSLSSLASRSWPVRAERESG